MRNRPGMTNCIFLEVAKSIKPLESTLQTHQAEVCRNKVLKHDEKLVQASVATWASSSQAVAAVRADCRQTSGRSWLASCSEHQRAVRPWRVWYVSSFNAHASANTSTTARHRQQEVIGVWEPISTPRSITCHIGSQRSASTERVIRQLIQCTC